MIGPVIPSLICLVTQVDQGPGSSQGQTGVIYSNSSKVHILPISQTSNSFIQEGGIQCYGDTNLITYPNPNNVLFSTI